MNQEEKQMMEDSEKGHQEIERLLNKHIGKMFDSLEAASIQYFINTGKINGAFRFNLVYLITEFAYKEIKRSQALLNALEEIKMLLPQDENNKYLHSIINEALSQYNHPF